MAPEHGPDEELPAAQGRVLSGTLCLVTMLPTQPMGDPRAGEAAKSLFHLKLFYDLVLEIN